MVFFSLPLHHQTRRRLFSGLVPFVVHSIPRLLVVDCDAPILHCPLISDHVASAIRSALRDKHIALLAKFIIPGLIIFVCTDSNSRLELAPSDAVSLDLLRQTPFWMKIVLLRLSPRKLSLLPHTSFASF